MSIIFLTQWWYYIFYMTCWRIWYQILHCTLHGKILGWEIQAVECKPFHCKEQQKKKTSLRFQMFNVKQFHNVMQKSWWLKYTQAHVFPKAHLRMLTCTLTRWQEWHRDKPLERHWWHAVWQHHTDLNIRLITLLTRPALLVSCICCVLDTEVLVTQLFFCW